MWRVGTHVSDGVECRPGLAHGFSWTELRRGMRDAQRDGACDGNEAEMGGLHPRGEPDTFYSSHCCLLTRRLWLGARSVLLALARPVLTQSTKARWSTSYMPLAQVASSIA